MTVTRAASSDASLLTLLPSVEPASGLLPFSPDRTDYTMTVDNATAAVAFTPAAGHPAAQVAVNGQPVASGTASGALPLTVGLNPVTLTVTAEDGTTTKSYFVNVIRAEMMPVLSSNADLASLVPGAGTLSPAFAPATTAYAVSVPNATAAFTLTPTTAEPNATLTVNGLSATSGTPIAPVALTVGANLLTVTVTAEDRLTVKSYVLTVTREDASAATIAISESNGILILIFTGTLESAATVDGPYAPVPGANSPFAAAVNADARFYRVR